MGLTQKIIHLTDLHFNPLHRIPQSRTAGFHRHIKGKWDHISSIIKEEKINFGVISGDIFHLKNPKIYCPEDISYYAKLFEETEIDWVAVPGNHDLPDSSFDQLEKSPYNLLVKATKNLYTLVRPIVMNKENNIKSVFMDCYSYKYQKDNLYFNSIPINIYGYPYYPLSSIICNLEKINERMGCDEGFKILLLHMDVIVDPNIFLFWSVAGYDTILDKLPNVDLICLGHIHQSFPVYRRINPITKRLQLISKPWSFTRVAKDYFNKIDVFEKQHRPSYGLITINQSKNNFNVQVEYREISFTPFEKAFKKDILKKQLESNLTIKSFMEEVKKNFGSIDKAFKVINPKEYLDKISMEEEVKNMLNKYIEECNI